jgi:hypothetical protein
MRQFLRYLSLLAVMISISWLAVPRWLHLEFPREPGPHFDARVRNMYTTLLNREEPDIIMLGDSTLMDGVNPKLLSDLTGKKVLSFGAPGSASAYWYVLLKNNIVVSKHPPQTIIIIFRDTMLTAPGFRVYGGFLTKIDEYVADQEPLLLERAYLNGMNPAQILAEKYIPLYSAREDIRQKIDSRIRYYPPKLLGCDRECTDSSMFNVFSAAELEPGQLQSRVTTVEQYLYTSSQMNFKENVDGSFLPEIIRLTREHQIQLIVVRLKPNTIKTVRLDTQSVRQYMSDLSEYLHSQGVIFLDYGRDPRLASEYYRDTLHLKPEGKTLFTEMLASGLNDALP